MLPSVLFFQLDRYRPMMVNLGTLVHRSFAALERVLAAQSIDLQRVVMLTYLSASGPSSSWPLDGRLQERSSAFLQMAGIRLAPAAEA